MTGPEAVTATGPGTPGGLARLKERARQVAHGVFGPVVALLARLGVRPDHVTVAGCLLSLGAALAFFEGAFRLGAGLVALSGLCDILDGELARHLGISSRFGAFLDSTLDRLSEGVVLAGIAGFYIVNLVDLARDPARVLSDLSRGLEPRTWAVVAITAMFAMIGSLMVSYTRARAEGLGLECKVGWFERPERLILVILAGAFGVGPAMPGALILLAGLSFATAAQRVAHVWKITRGAGHDR